MRFAVLFTAALLIAPAAQADIFVWEDAETGLSLSYPDTWEMEHNQQPDTILTVVGPDYGALPLCRVRAREDNRYRMYPPRYEDEIRDVSYAEDFWNDYLPTNYENVRISQGFDDAGLAQSFASWATFSYDGEGVQEGDGFRKGVAFVSHYFDTAYIVECTAANQSFPEWMPHFMNLIKSVDFKPVYGTTTEGYYRNFLTKDADYEDSFLDKITPWE